MLRGKSGVTRTPTTAEEGMTLNVSGMDASQLGQVIQAAIKSDKNVRYNLD